MATASDDRAARLWDTATGTLKVTLLPLDDGGFAVLLPDGSYKLGGDAGGAFWWAMKSGPEPLPLVPEHVHQSLPIPGGRVTRYPSAVLTR